MPNPAYAKLKINGSDIPGETSSKGMDGLIEVMELHHEVKTPTDIGTGLPSGQRIHGPVRLIKQIDKTSPKLYEALIGNHEVELEIYWYKADDKGAMQNHFKHTLKKGRVSTIKLYMPYTRDPAKDRYTELEEVSIVYGSIHWEHPIAAIEAIDEGWHARV